MIYKEQTYKRVNGYDPNNPNYRYVKRPTLKWAHRHRQTIMVFPKSHYLKQLNEMPQREAFELGFPNHIINTLPWVLEYYEGEEMAETIIDVLRTDLINIKEAYMNSKAHTFDVLKGTDTDDKITKLLHKHIIKYLKPWRTKHGGCSGVRHIDREHKDIYISARIYFWAEGIVPRTTTIRRGDYK